MKATKRDKFVGFEQKINADWLLNAMFTRQIISSLKLSYGIIDIFSGLMFIVAIFNAKEKSEKKETAKEFESEQEAQIKESLRETFICFKFRQPL